MEDFSFKATMYVYIIKAQDGAFKVGFTGNLEQRLRSLQTAQPYKLKYYKVFQIEDDITLARRVENKLKDEFKRWGTSLEGEWYDIKEKQVDIISFHLLTRDNCINNYGLVQRPIVHPYDDNFSR